MDDLRVPLFQETPTMCDYRCNGILRKISKWLARIGLAAFASTISWGSLRKLAAFMLVQVHISEHVWETQMFGGNDAASFMTMEFSFNQSWRNGLFKMWMCHRFAMSICTFRRVFICMYIYIYVCVCVYMYVYQQGSICKHHWMLIRKE